jgi:hypothetical protein
MFDVNHMHQEYLVVVGLWQVVEGQEMFVRIVCKILRINLVAGKGFEVEGTLLRTGAVSKEGQVVYQVEIAGTAEIAVVGAAGSGKMENDS